MRGTTPLIAIVQATLTMPRVTRLGLGDGAVVARRLLIRSTAVERVPPVERLLTGVVGAVAG